MFFLVISGQLQYHLKCMLLWYCMFVLYANMFSVLIALLYQYTKTPIIPILLIQYIMCSQISSPECSRKDRSEYDQFWKILGIKSEYSSQKIARDQESDAHLFCCTFLKGKKEFIKFLASICSLTPLSFSM